MEKEKIGYSIHAKGELKQVVTCPMGKYFVDVEHKFYWFQPNEDFDLPKAAERIATIMAAICDVKGIKMGKVVGAIIQHCARLDDEHVSPTENPEIMNYEFKIEGELFAYVEEPTLGTLYGNHDREVFFFEPHHKGFMGPILKKKFREGIEKDAESEDADKRVAAIAVIEIFDNWVELDDEDIVK